MTQAPEALFTRFTRKLVKDNHQKLTIPPMERSKSSVRINTMLGLWYVLAITPRLLIRKATQIKLKWDVVWRNNRIIEAMFAEKLKTHKASHKKSFIRLKKPR